MVDKTTRFVLGHEQFKTIGCSRTDSKVSALHFAFELMVDESLDTDKLLSLYNQNFPQDIRATSVEISPEGFNIINGPKLKEYVYFFAHGPKPHPFSAPFLVNFESELDIDLMKQGARFFEGRHNYRKYCTKPTKHTVVERDIIFSRIEENKQASSDFFPDKTYIYRVQAKGFMRNQVRLMMGQLILLGKGQIELSDIRSSLLKDADGPFDYIAPASGLLLNRIEFL